MRSRRRTALLLSYLGVSLFGWFLFGVLLRAELDLIGVGQPSAVGIVLLAVFGGIMSVGTAVGYLTIRVATWDWNSDARGRL